MINQRLLLIHTVVGAKINYFYSWAILINVFVFHTVFADKTQGESVCSVYHG